MGSCKAGSKALSMGGMSVSVNPRDNRPQRRYDKRTDTQQSKYTANVSANNIKVGDVIDPSLNVNGQRKRVKWTDITNNTQIEARLSVKVTDVKVGNKTVTITGMYKSAHSDTYDRKVTRRFNKTDVFMSAKQ